MIDVRLYAHLPAVVAAAAVESGETEFQVEARPGLTVRDVVTETGIPAEAVFIVTINNDRAGLDTVLADGDHLGLFPAVSGG